MKNAQFKVEDVFGDILEGKTIQPKQITKLENFPAKKIEGFFLYEQILD